MRPATGRWPGRVRRVPYVPQGEETDCAPACLASVLARFGRRVPLRELREATGASRDGVDAARLLRTARGYGLAARAVRVTIPWHEGTPDPAPLSGLRLPAIAHLADGHFVVLERVRGDQVIVVDPALGRFPWQLAELAPRLSGVMLLLEPGPEFVRGGRRQRVLPRVGALLARQWPGVLASLLLSLLTGLASLLLALVLKLLAGAVPAGGSGGAGVLAAVAVGVAVFSGAVAAAQNQVLGRIQVRQVLMMSVDLVWRVLHIDGTVLLRRDPGAMAARIQTADGVCLAVTHQVLPGLSGLVTAAVLGTVIVHEDPVVGGAAVGLGVLVVVLPLAGLRRQTAAALTEQRTATRRDATAYSALRGLEAVKAAGGEDDVLGHWTSLHAGSVRAGALHTRAQQVLTTVPGVAGLAAACAVVLLAAPRIQQVRMTLGSLFAIQSLTGAFVAAAGSVVAAVLAMPGLRTQFGLLDDLLDEAYDPGAIRPAGTDPGRRLSGEVSLAGISAGYRPDRPVLRDVDLLVRPGEWLAVTGPTGAGKTSLARVLAGVLRPDAGTVRLAGRDTTTVPRDLLVRSVAWVDQNIELFAGTVADNLTLWDATVPAGRLERALRDACLDEVVAARGGPYRAVVAEGGANFSGGERQRLEIARALVVDPSVLILDEATGALDRPVERELFARLRSRGLTVVMLAHRRSAVAACDREVVVAAGHVVDARQLAAGRDPGAGDRPDPAPVTAAGVAR